MTTILGIAGSMRTESTTIMALKIALKGAEKAGAKTQLLDVRALKLPMFNGTYSLTGYTKEERKNIEVLLKAVHDADGLILASPTYNSNLSGSFKNALDFLEVEHDRYTSRLKDKVAAITTVQGGTSGTGVNALTSILLTIRAMGAWVSPKMICITGIRESFDENGIILVRSYGERLQAMGEEMSRMSRIFSEFRESSNIMNSLK